ncbi:hypothetical protein GCM10010156_47990 [Planobispora rosea]|uniref:Integral membrane protein n=1 Tax=Planobispora rosea TaxID=35762 RepID=A0A8J3S3U2_PLARO|nr:hypothetical protein [Planobispora rosea]GGS83748.1 hypothetical protein GCM10010156_47990 [Planobispora rosea]GIH86310.1 hypothetical protein Pro02_47180 [Planobispora rosea]
MFLRAAIALQTLALFSTPVTAGLLLSTPSGHTLHSASSYGVFVATVLHLVTAVLVWRPGGGSPRPILHAAGFLGLVLAQVALGIAGLKTLHIPLGVLLFGLSLLQLSRVWAGRRVEAPAADRRDDEVHAMSGRPDRP